MLCTTERCPASVQRGFTLVEMLVVISLVVLMATFAGTSVLDQLRSQQVASAIQNARVIASAIEQIRPRLIAHHTSTFSVTPSVYNETLNRFMKDMDVATVLKSGLQEVVYDAETILGQSAGTVYSVTLTEQSTFVTLTLDSSFAEFEFFSTAKNVTSDVSWTVAPRTLHPSTIEFRFLNEINK